jgi:serine/threonine protein kinase
MLRPTQSTIINNDQQPDYHKNAEKREIFQNFISQRKEKKGDAQPLELDDFKIGLQIGSGAFAVVKRAYHKKTNYCVALKQYEKKNLTSSAA